MAASSTRQSFKDGSAGLTGSLTVDIHFAHDLLACDANGLSDPFCVITTLPDVGGKGHQEAKTGVRKKTLNPTWYDSHRLSIEGAQQLQVSPHR